MGTVFTHGRNGGCFTHLSRHHHHGMPGCEGDMIRRIPVLRFLQQPVLALEDLYKRHPLGGQPGFFAFVYKANTFAFWHHGRNRWELIRGFLSVKDFFAIFGLVLNDIKDYQVLMWNKEERTFRPFVIRTVTTVPTTKMDAGVYLVVGKGVYVVEDGEVKLIVGKASWGDIDGKPSISEFQSDWNETDIAKLSYIWNKPSSQSVNDSLIRIFQGANIKGVFTLNQDSPKDIVLDVAADDFSGYTIQAVSYFGLGSPGSTLSMACNVPMSAYDTSTGVFNNSALMRLRFNINPFAIAPPDPQAPHGHPLNILNTGLYVTPVPPNSFAWDLKHYGSNDPVLADELFFEREIYLRYDSATNTLFWRE